MIAIVIVSAILTIALVGQVLSENTFDLTQINSISSEVELDSRTPQAVLKEQLRKGNINRNVYEMLISEKLGLNIA